MGFNIVTNPLALNAQHQLEKTDSQLGTTMRHLASGSRITQASEDPAGLAISDILNSQVRSFGQAIRNAQDAISMVQVHEGGASEIGNLLIRIRELAIQSSSDTIGDNERDLINQESSQLTQEITRIARSTQYKGKELLSGASTDWEFQVGPHNDPEIDRIRFTPGDTDLTAGALGIEGLSLTDKSEAQNSLETLDAALNKVNGVRTRVGAVQSRLNSTIQSEQTMVENYEMANSQIRDADVAMETSNLAKQSILKKAGIAVLAQANEMPAMALQLLRAG